MRRHDPLPDQDRHHKRERAGDHVGPCGVEFKKRGRKHRAGDPREAPGALRDAERETSPHPGIDVLHLKRLRPFPARPPLHSMLDVERWKF